MLEGIVVDPECKNFERLPNIAFEFDGVEYTLEPNDYVLKVIQYGKEQCMVSLMSAAMPD
jgi:hypothetical protein